MKYLRKFENDIFNNLKKYVIAGVGKQTQLVVMRVTEKFPDRVDFKRIYIYWTDSDRLNKSDGKEFNFYINWINKNVLYTSDNLQDIFNILPTIKDIKKFNL